MYLVKRELRTSKYKYILLDFKQRRSSGWRYSIAETFQNLGYSDTSSWGCTDYPDQEITNYLHKADMTILVKDDDIINNHPELLI